MLHAFKNIRGAIGPHKLGSNIDEKIFQDWYLPVIEFYINDKKTRKIPTYVIGIQGAQGSGKTFLASFMKTLFNSLGYATESVSIDDFYKSNSARIKLARTYKNNPFYQIPRGMPGTHRYGKLLEIIKKAKAGEPFSIPRFDKSRYSGRGEVLKTSTHITNRLKFFIVEGWCVNIPYVRDRKFLATIKRSNYVNAIFNELDPRKQHYKIVMGYIKKYQHIWKSIDNKTLLVGKNIQFIRDWRAEQEEELRHITGEGMSDEEIGDFVKPFIPFSYFSSTVARRTNGEHSCILTLGKNHIPTKVEFPKTKTL